MLEFGPIAGSSRGHLQLPIFGTFKQTQVLVNVNGQAGKWLTLFSRYSYNNSA